MTIKEDFERYCEKAKEHLKIATKKQYSAQYELVDVF